MSGYRSRTVVRTQYFKSVMEGGGDLVSNVDGAGLNLTRQLFG